jgi:quinol-cytochrome oxidoreductase complex cytochrome b subunit
VGAGSRFRWKSLRRSQFWRSIFRVPLPADDRDRQALVLSDLFLHLHPPRVSAASIRLRRTFCMGGIAFLLFVVLTVSGALLMIYYRPTPEWAYADIQEIDFTVPYGRLLRNLHRWSGHAMILVVIAHMARVFYAGAYRPPREFNWVIGVLLLVFTLFLSFTGYLLPWDQLAFWAVTVGSGMAGAVPLVGHAGPFALVGPAGDVQAFLLGGESVGANALLRFYVLHCVIIPLVMVVFMGIHFYRVRKDGGVAARY